MNTKKIMPVAIATASVLMTGCHTTQNVGLYHWGDYEASLYEYYKDPAQEPQLSDTVLKAIDESEGRIAPGMYAEYATLLLQQGRVDEAIEYYTKERDYWPESRALMDSIIAQLTRNQSNRTQEEN